MILGARGRIASFTKSTTHFLTYGLLYGYLFPKFLNFSMGLPKIIKKSAVRQRSFKALAITPVFNFLGGRKPLRKMQKFMG